MIRRTNLYHLARSLAILIVTSGLATTTALAEPARKDNAAALALRKAQGALRELTEQRAALEAERQRLQEQLQKTEARVHQLEPLQGELQSQRAALEQTRHTASALEVELASARERETSLRQQQRATVQTAKAIAADNQLLVEAVKERESWIGQCTERNRSLIETQHGLIDRYRDKSFWDALKQAEPLTGIGNVQAENAEQDYRFKVQDLKATPFEPQTELPAERGKAADRGVSADEDED